MATKIELSEMKSLKDKMHENGTSYYGLLSNLFWALWDAGYALNQTTYNDICNTISNTLEQIDNIRNICYGAFTASESYLLKKISQYELAANSAYEKLNAAVDDLMSIWDNIDMTTWQNI